MNVKVAEFDDYIRVIGSGVIESASVKNNAVSGLSHRYAPADGSADVAG